MFETDSKEEYYFVNHNSVLKIKISLNSFMKGWFDKVIHFSYITNHIDETFEINIWNLLCNCETFCTLSNYTTPTHSCSLVNFLMVIHSHDLNICPVRYSNGKWFFSMLLCRRLGCTIHSCLLHPSIFMAIIFYSPYCPGVYWNLKSFSL